MCTAVVRWINVGRERSRLCSITRSLFFVTTDCAEEHTSFISLYDTNTQPRIKPAQHHHREHQARTSGSWAVMMRHEPPATVATPAPPPLPTTVRWIPDAEVSLCFGCQLLFDWVRRKHHCRYAKLIGMDAHPSYIAHAHSVVQVLSSSQCICRSPPTSVRTCNTPADSAVTCSATCARRTGVSFAKTRSCRTQSGSTCL